MGASFTAANVTVPETTLLFRRLSDTVTSTMRVIAVGLPGRAMVLLYASVESTCSKCATVSGPTSKNLVWLTCVRVMAVPETSTSKNSSSPSGRAFMVTRASSSTLSSSSKTLTFGKSGRGPKPSTNSTMTGSPGEAVLPTTTGSSLTISISTWV